MPKSANLPFLALFLKLSYLRLDEWIGSRFWLDPRFSANLRHGRFWLPLKSKVPIPNRWLVLFLLVNAKNRPYYGQMSILWTTWRLATSSRYLKIVTAPEILNPKIVLWPFLNQFVSDFNSETTGTSKLILIHLDLYENIGHKKWPPPPPSSRSPTHYILRQQVSADFGSGSANRESLKFRFSSN